MYHEYMSLANVTKEARLSLKIGGAVIALVIILFIVIKGGGFVASVLFPKPPAPPQEGFGELPSIAFPQSTNTIPEFRVNTVSGVLPGFAPTIPVYKLKENAPTITALQTAKIKAGSLGYTQNQQEISSNVYRWSKDGENNSLLYNIVSFDFSVNSDYLNNPNLTIGDLSSSQNLTNAAFGFIDALGADRLDIDSSKSIISYYALANGQLTPTDSPTSASVARIYFIQNQVNQLSIYYPTTNPSTLFFTLSGPQSENVVEANYNHFAPDLAQFSTYPLKTADEALADLKNGKGYIVRPTTASTVDITDVTLGYYLSDNPTQKYLMPIIVFTGANNFQAYVSGVR